MTWRDQRSEIDFADNRPIPSKLASSATGVAIAWELPDPTVAWYG